MDFISSYTVFGAIGLAMEDQRDHTMPPEISNISCGFALQEVVSQTKYCCC